MLAARETKMLSAERMERMIDAPTNDEAAKILEECGYGDLSGLSAKEAGAALEAHIAALFDEVEGMVPEVQLVQLFRLKYDYHNAKALIKAQAMGVECDAILSQRGTIPPQKLLTAFLEEDYRDIPPFWRRLWSAPPRSWRTRPIRRRRTSSSTARISRRCSIWPTV